MAGSESCPTHHRILSTDVRFWSVFGALASRKHKRPEVKRMNLVIDALTAADWEQVRAIYLDGIATGQAPFEVAAPTCEEWDAAHHLFARLAPPLRARPAHTAPPNPAPRH